MQALLHKEFEVSIVAFTDRSGYQRITESHFPGKYLDIALIPRQYLDIALVAGQYKIYCPAMAFDPPTQCYIFNKAMPSFYEMLSFQIKVITCNTCKL